MDSPRDRAPVERAVEARGQRAEEDGLGSMVGGQMAWMYSALSAYQPGGAVVKFASANEAFIQVYWTLQ